MTIFNPLKQELTNLLNKAVKACLFEGVDVEIERTKNDAFGDFQTNIALILAKKLGKNPNELAELIVTKIEQNEVIAKIEVKSPGFINIFLNNNYLLEQFLRSSQNKSFLKPNIGNQNKVVIEYSQPNIAKPLGVHHLLSTIIGQSLVNLYQYLNFDVIKINHIGDWGTQFGKLIYAYKTWGDEKEVLKNPIPKLLELYVKFHNEAEKDARIEDKGREEFNKLENGDKENLRLWMWIRDLSLKEIKNTYNKIEGITFEDKDYIGESFYNDKMNEIIEDGKKKGVFKLSQGALIAEIDDETPPLLVIKNDGSTLYATRDLAQVKYRTSLGIKKNMMVVDVAQSLHFKQFFYVAKKLGLNKGKQGEVVLEHVIFGRMQLPDKQMSTRKGTVILLDDLLDEAILRSYKLVGELNPSLDEKRKKHIAKLSGLGAVKYNILSQNRIHNITFEWDKMITLDGNSAPYLQYTHARALSVLGKNNVEVTDGMNIENCQEKDLLFAIFDFPDILNRSLEEDKPHHIAIYLYNLATLFNSFYNTCPIIKSKESSRNLRLALTAKVAEVIKIALNLLVIEAPDEM